MSKFKNIELRIGFLNAGSQCGVGFWESSLNYRSFSGRAYDGWRAIGDHNIESD